ncbi:MAG: MOSC domain-containing protein [Vicinamibacterales bacterium]
MRIGEPVLRGVFVGRPESRGQAGSGAWHDEPWTTGIFKQAAAEPVTVTSTGLAGDGQADLVHHGGPDKALCAYSADHYPEWRRRLGLADFAFGAFGENVTIDGLVESAVCIGDTWAMGGVMLQVSQPRQPCWKLARRWRLTTLTREVVDSGWTGWYFRVLRGGVLTTGLPLSLLERPHPGWTIDAANRVMHGGTGDRRALGAVPELSESWRRALSTP